MGTVSSAATSFPKHPVPTASKPAKVASATNRPVKAASIPTGPAKPASVPNSEEASESSGTKLSEAVSAASTQRFAQVTPHSSGANITKLLGKGGIFNKFF